jgi:hypothetical protein
MPDITIEQSFEFIQPRFGTFGLMKKASDKKVKK